MARYTVAPSQLGRYYFLECDRFLRYTATPRERRAAEGVPARRFDPSAVTRAILATGSAWEEAVLTQHLPDAVVGDLPPEGGELTDRMLSYAEAIEALRRATPGTTIYQPTLRAPAAFYARYGLDPDLVTFGGFRPDLLWVDDWGDGPQVRVVDLKASDHMKLGHRVQVGIYTLLLTHVLDAEAVPLAPSRHGGVWLYQAAAPEWFPLSGIVPPIETFLERELTPLLTAPADRAFWHLYYRCEWCDFYPHCRAEAEAGDDVSLVPYLSAFAKRHLAARAGVRTVGDLDGLLRRDDADEVLRGSASLEGRRDRLARVVEALRTGEPLHSGAHSAAMPRGEGVRLTLSVQADPLTGEAFGYALNRLFGADVFGGHRATVARVAADGHPDTLAALRRDLVDDLYAVLRPVHDHNAATDDWHAQLSVQAYVFDSYERELLVASLLRVVEEEADVEVMQRALGLLFWFQHPDLAAADDQPAREVLFPLVVLTEVLRGLFALPIPVIYRFADVVAALRPSRYGFDYRPHPLFDFELSNRLRADAVLQAWTGENPQRLDQVQGRLRERVWAASAVVDGLREHLPDGVLFAYPPRFRLPPSLGFTHPVLSRLAFIAQYEKVLGYLDVRATRMRGLPESLAAGDTYELVYEGDGWYRVHARHSDLDVEPGPFEQRLLSCDTEAGRRGRLAYDDFRGRWAPSRHAVAIATVTDAAEAAGGWRLRLGLDHREAFTPPAPGDRCWLDRWFVDWNTVKVVEALAAHDALDDPWFVRLLQDPAATRRRLTVDPGLRAAALGVAAGHGMTPSQLAAFEATVDHDVQLVWGPPGTGKTHYLALAVLALAEAHRGAGRPLRVLVTAMSHPAIDNVLAKLAELQRRGVFGGRLAVRKLNSEGGGAARLDHRDAAAWAGQHPVCVLGSTVWQVHKVDPDDLAYDLVVVDEGSQVKVGEAAIPLLRVAAGGRVVVAGDDRQLPPIVNGAYPEVDGEPLLHRSILECLRAGDPGDEATVALLENWRMCDGLCRYPAATIYPAGYAPATAEVAARRLPGPAAGEDDELAAVLLDPDHPVVVAVLEGVAATAENRVEAALVARVTAALRQRFAGEDDEAFWARRLFVVSPHHVQLRAIRRALADVRDRDAPPFVGTVDKMQGQERDAVIVSYGVSDVEYALGERDFIYSLNRLNVAITRARAKSIVFLPRPLLEPPIQALDSDRAADGIAFMQGLANWCQHLSEPSPIELPEGRLTILRGLS